MKKYLALFLLSTVAAFAQMHTFDLAGQGRLTLYLADDWSVEDRSIAKSGAIMFKPRKESVNASCAITISYPDKDRYDTKERLKQRLEGECLGLAQECEEERAYGTPLALSVPGAFGFVCNFTDPKLRGKPPEKGNFKVISVARIRLTPQIQLDVQIMADSFKDTPYQQLLGAIEGMEFAPARGR